MNNGGIAVGIIRDEHKLVFISFGHHSEKPVFAFSACFREQTVACVESGPLFGMSELFEL